MTIIDAQPFEARLADGIGELHGRDARHVIGKGIHQQFLLHLHQLRDAVIVVGHAGLQFHLRRS